MESLRRLAEKTIFKFFLFFIATSFVIFGIAGFLFGNSKYNIASVGNYNISIVNYNNTLNRYKNLIYRQNPTKENMDYLNSRQFKIEILDDMIAGRLLKKSAEDLGFRLNDDVIIDGVIQSRNFRDEEGRFNKELFEDFLNANNLTEVEYIEKQKIRTSQEVIINIFSNTVETSDKRVNDINKYRNETRIVDIITLSKNSLSTEIDITESELKNYYSNNREKFILPEMKTISYIEISPEKIKEDIVIEESIIENYYTGNKNSFIRPETRDIYILGFDNKEDAKKAKILIKNKEEFLSKAEEIGKTKEEITAKGLTKNVLPKKIADILFNTEKDKISEIVEGVDKNFYIMYVNNIEPQKQLTFAEVKDDIIDNFKNSKLEEKLSLLIQNIEDSILGSNNISEIGDRYKLNLLTTEPFSLNSDKEIFNHYTENENKYLIKESFVLNEGEFSEIIPLEESNKYILLFNKKDSPERTREFSEVKDEVTKLVRIEKNNDELLKLAQKIKKQLDKNIPIKNIGFRNNAKVETDVEFKRDSGYLSEAIFETTLNFPTEVVKTDEEEFKIAVVNKIVEADESNLPHIKREIKNSITKDLMDSYERYLRNKYPVEIQMDMINNIQ